MKTLFWQMRFLKTYQTHIITQKPGLTTFFNVSDDIVKKHCFTVNNYALCYANHCVLDSPVNYELFYMNHCVLDLPVNCELVSVWLAQLVRALATPTHVRSCVQEVRVRSPERTSLTLASIPSG